MTLDPEYEDFILRLTKHFRSAGYTTADMLLKVSEENGEMAEAWIMSRGLKPGKGYAREVDVANELIDLVAAALVAVIQLGFQPSMLLADHREKMIERFLS